MIYPIKKDWSIQLDYALWAHSSVYKTSIGMPPYRMVFRKQCRLLMELVHRAYWAIKKHNMSMDEATKERRLDIQELEQIQNDAYENEAIYKEK